jgi:hypothetical protein
MSLGLATPPATESVVGPYPLPEPAQDPIRAKQPPADPHDELLRERAVFRTGGLRTRAASRRDERAEALSPGEQQPSEDTSAVFDFEDD